jgi:hypothetical protein
MLGGFGNFVEGCNKEISQKMGLAKITIIAATIPTNQL